MFDIFHLLALASLTEEISEIKMQDPFLNALLPIEMK
jgi:hypothetical protein